MDTQNVSVKVLLQTNRAFFATAISAFMVAVSLLIFFHAALATIIAVLLGLGFGLAAWIRKTHPEAGTTQTTPLPGLRSNKAVHSYEQLEMSDRLERLNERRLK